MTSEQKKERPMIPIKILIVEDELIIAEDIRMQLIKLGYQVTGIAKSYDSAMELLEEDPPELMLVDIVLKGERDGIELAQIVKKNYDLPVVFLTSHTDRHTVEKAKKVNPEGYLLKPFQKEDLYTSIEIALSNFIERASHTETSKGFENEQSQVFKNSIFVKKDHLLIKIRFEELKWLKAERNYIELHCDEKMHLTRSTLRELLEKLPSDQFIQVHRSFAVNLEHISAIEYSALFIGKNEIPIGRSFIDSIKKRLNLEM
jgi:DNA-binding LytR/AlgR family response regulator